MRKLLRLISWERKPYPDQANYRDEMAKRYGIRAIFDFVYGAGMGIVASLPETTNDAVINNFDNVMKIAAGVAFGAFFYNAYRSKYYLEK